MTRPRFGTPGRRIFEQKSCNGLSQLQLSNDAGDAHDAGAAHEDAHDAGAAAHDDARFRNSELYLYMMSHMRVNCKCMYSTSFF